MKSLFLSICCLGLLCSCGEKQEASQSQITDTQVQNNIQISIPEELKEITFSFSKDNLPSKCQSNNELVCAIEETVKCALSPTQKYCDSQSMPEFIFYDDAMFADDGVTGRPTKQSFKIIKSKPIDETTAEIFTIGECDKNWFGSCDGNIIYVMSNKTGKWKVKEIYAIEKIK